jgi:hypothetical protein
LHYATRYELEKKLIDVRKLLNQGETGKGISKKMNVPLRTAERYIQRVYEQDKESWSRLSTESLEHRALIIKSHYEKLAKISEEILHDEEKSPKDRIEAYKNSSYIYKKTSRYCRLGSNGFGYSERCFQKYLQ